MHTAGFLGSIKRVDIWDRAITTAEYTEYKNRELYGNVISSEDLTTWVSDYSMSTAVRIPAGRIFIIIQY